MVWVDTNIRQIIKRIKKKKKNRKKIRFFFYSPILNRVYFLYLLPEATNMEMEI